MMIQNIYKKIYRSTSVPNFPKEIAHIISICFTIDPKRRIDILVVKKNIPEVKILPFLSMNTFLLNKIPI